MPTRRIGQFQARSNFEHEWHIGLCGAPCHDPCCWMASCFFFPCVNYTMRSRALDGNFNLYRCFQGYGCFCCSNCCVSCQQTLAPCCLCFESICCPHLSTFATRHYLQDKYRVRNTECEDCCFCLVAALECCLCFDEDSCGHEFCSCAIHLICCFVFPCMHVQHNAQIEYENQTGLQMALMKADQPYQPPLPQQQYQQQQYQQQQYQQQQYQQQQRYQPAQAYAYAPPKAPAAQAMRVDDEPTSQVTTSEIRKYHIGQEVTGLGGGYVSGFVHRIQPHTHGATSGPGTLFVGIMPVASTPGESSGYLDDNNIQNMSHNIQHTSHQNPGHEYAGHTMQHTSHQQNHALPGQGQ